MANTVIQLKYSTITDKPTSLNVAEPAYSYSSNTFYIGSPSGTGSIAIGGKFYLDQQAQIFDSVNAAFEAANTAYTAGGQFAYAHANAAFDKANTVGDTADSGFIQANAAYAQVNATQTYATASFNHANAAFEHSNTAITTSGGTISGSLNITSNLVIQGDFIVHGTTTQVDTTTILIRDNIITLNAAIDQAGTPLLDAGLEIDRGSSANVYLKWNETADKWQATNDGTNYFNLASDASESYANSAFEAANTAQISAVSGFFQENAEYEQVNVTQIYAEAAFSLANGTAVIANTDWTGVTTTAADYGNAAYVSAFKVEANGRISSANSTAIAIGAGAITSGTLGVERGGTGVDSLTLNGVVLGQGTGGLSTASSSTEGHVLTINSSGVPTFSYLSGGTF